MKILIVDDVKLVRVSLKKVLESLGFTDIEIADVSSIAGIYDVVIKVKPDVILLDLSLFGEISIPLIPKLKSICNSQVVMCTGERETSMVVDAIKNGATDYLIKPIDTARLNHTLFKIKVVTGIQ